MIVKMIQNLCRNVMWTGHSPFLYVDGPSSQTDPLGPVVVDISEADVWKVPRSKCWEWSLHRILEHDTWNKQQILSGETAWSRRSYRSNALCETNLEVLLLLVAIFVDAEDDDDDDDDDDDASGGCDDHSEGDSSDTIWNYHSPRPEKSSWRVLYKAPTAITEYIYLSLPACMCVWIYRLTSITIKLLCHFIISPRQPQRLS